ncbi:hypothetical protein CBS101457_003687 [Exobasidium rhododendri]|nr:hypothetical protein CBS101457_003687 [Exobasidium rhododendri]
MVMRSGLLEWVKAARRLTRPQGGTSSRTIFSPRKSESPLLRFAPSPTGQLHLGGLRTALFNHLFARKLAGRWILRIEDTDQKRYVEGSAAAMQKILTWSGLEYDEGPDKPGKCGPYHQSERLPMYSSYAQRLIDEGKAYRDFRAEGEDIRTEEAYIPPSKKEEDELIRGGRSFTIRLRMPKHKAFEYRDLVYGKMSFPYDEMIGDPVLVKSDGWPTYHLANVVDDHEMGITHVLRGEEWLPSTPIHLSLYQALSLPPPEFAHLPLLINLDGSKLSKRHADVHVESYKQQGFEPEALINFVGLMGYNWHGSKEEVVNIGAEDDTSEVFTMQDMIDRFNPLRISQSRANPNLSKLLFLNKQHLCLKLRDGTTTQRQDLAARLTHMIRERWPDDRITGALGQDRVLVMADIFAGRVHTLSEIVDQLQLVLDQPDWTSQEAQEMLALVGPLEYERVVWKTHSFLSSMQQKDVEDLSSLEAALKDLLILVEEDRVAKGGARTKKSRGKFALMKPLRLALSAKKSGPTVAEAISLLGKGPTLQRLEEAMQHLGGSSSTA